MPPEKKRDDLGSRGKRHEEKRPNGIFELNGPPVVAVTDKRQLIFNLTLARSCCGGVTWASCEFGRTRTAALFGYSLLITVWQLPLMHRNELQKNLL